MLSFLACENFTAGGYAEALPPGGQQCSEDHVAILGDGKCLTKVSDVAAVGVGDHLLEERHGGHGGCERGHGLLDARVVGTSHRVALRSRRRVGCLRIAQTSPVSTLSCARIMAAFLQFSGLCVPVATWLHHKSLCTHHR